MRRVILPIEEISRKYIELEYTAYQLASEYGISPATVQRKLRASGLIRNNKTSHKTTPYLHIMRNNGRHRLPLPDEEIAYKYSVLGIGIPQLAREYNTSPRAITLRLKSIGVSIRTVKESHSIPSYRNAITISLPTANVIRERLWCNIKEIRTQCRYIQ